jgi:hypothetical protein
MTADNFFVVTVGVYGALKFLIVENETSRFLFMNYSAWILIYGSMMTCTVALGDSAQREVFKFEFMNEKFQFIIL